MGATLLHFTSVWCSWVLSKVKMEISLSGLDVKANNVCVFQSKMKLVFNF